MQEKQRINEYFEKMPALIREKYHSNKEEFYNEIMYGNHNSLINNGILTNEHSQQLIQQRPSTNIKVKELEEQVNILKQQLGEQNAKI